MARTDFADEQFTTRITFADAKFVRENNDGSIVIEFNGVAYNPELLGNVHHVLEDAGWSQVFIGAAQEHISELALQQLIVSRLRRD